MVKIIADKIKFFLLINVLLEIILKMSANIAKPAKAPGSQKGPEFLAILPNIPLLPVLIV